MLLAQFSLIIYMMTWTCCGTWWQRSFGTWSHWRTGLLLWTWEEHHDWEDMMKGLKLWLLWGKNVFINQRNGCISVTFDEFCHFSRNIGKGCWEHLFWNLLARLFWNLRTVLLVSRARTVLLVHSWALLRQILWFFPKYWLGTNKILSPAHKPSCSHSGEIVQSCEKSMILRMYLFWLFWFFPFWECDLYSNATFSVSDSGAEFPEKISFQFLLFSQVLDIIKRSLFW